MKSKIRRKIVGIFSALFMLVPIAWYMGTSASAADLCTIYISPVVYTSASHNYIQGNGSSSCNGSLVVQQRINLSLQYRTASGQATLLGTESGWQDRGLYTSASTGAYYCTWHTLRDYRVQMAHSYTSIYGYSGIHYHQGQWTTIGCES